MICLDELLYGEPKWPMVVDFFINGEFCEEHYLVEAIEKYLLTPEQKTLLSNHTLSIEKILNGRVPANKLQIVKDIYDNWNSKLGFKVFKS